MKGRILFKDNLTAFKKREKEIRKNPIFSYVKQRYDENLKALWEQAYPTFNLDKSEPMEINWDIEARTSNRYIGGIDPLCHSEINKDRMREKTQLNTDLLTPGFLKLLHAPDPFAKINSNHLAAACLENPRTYEQEDKIKIKQFKIVTSNIYKEVSIIILTNKLRTNV